MSKNIVRSPEEAAAFGKELGLVQEAVLTGRRLGYGKEFWTHLAHDGDLFIIAADAMQAALDFTAPRPTFSVTVDYGQLKGQMLQAARCYTGCIQYDFSADGVGTTDIVVEIFQIPGTQMTGRDLDDFLNKRGYRGAKLAEALAVCAAHGDALWDLSMHFGGKKFLALGTKVKNSHPTVFLATSEDPHWKDIWFSLSDIDTVGVCMERFLVLAVRKLS